jgi:vitamin B12 transporter
VNPYTTVFGRIDNLFNEHYQNLTGFERPGFGIYGGIRVANR